MSASIVRRGRAHVFGNAVPLDEGVMAFKYAIGRITDPAELIPHLFEPIDPGFAARVQRGDLVVAGADFGCGKPHIQGFIAMAALGMGVLCGSMPYKAMRGAISKGLPVLTGCGEPGDWVADGDEIEVNFATGEARNLTRGTTAQLPPMPEVLQPIIAQGGADGQLAAWLTGHPAQRASEGAPSALRSGQPVTVVRKAGAAASA
jgi:3-isopropylmalate/(R)-2-methylmalate dehydratase small subunit